MEKIMIKAYIPLDLYNEMMNTKGDDSISRFVREALKTHIPVRKSVTNPLYQYTYTSTSTPSSAISPKE